MSLSVDPEFIAERGIVGVGGPYNGKVIDDSGLIYRSIRMPGGFYKLRGRADGKFEYLWAPDGEAPPRQ